MLDGVSGRLDPVSAGLRRDRHGLHRGAGPRAGARRRVRRHVHVALRRSQKHRPRLCGSHTEYAARSSGLRVLSRPPLCGRHDGTGERGHLCRGHLSRRLHRRSGARRHSVHSARPGRSSRLSGLHLRADHALGHPAPDGENHPAPRWSTRWSTSSRTRPSSRSSAARTS